MASTFAQRLKYAMDQAKVNQILLACAVGAPKSAISQYLSGKNIPGPERMEALAQALGCTVEFLRGEEEQQEKRLPQKFLELKKISVPQAARCLGISDKVLRRKLLEGKLDLGFGLAGDKRGTFYISPYRLRRLVGAERFDYFFHIENEEEARA